MSIIEHFSPFPISTLLKNTFFIRPILLMYSDRKPLSVEVDEASTLRLLGAEQENAILRRRLDELQAQQEVSC